MDEDGGPVARQHEVRSAWQVGRVEPEAEAGGMKASPERHLGARVPAADTRHHAGARVPIHDVGHAVVACSNAGKPLLIRSGSNLSGSSFLQPYAVVDVFAGPGGLAEGFSSVRGPDGRPAYHVELSIEKDAVAHRTLRLRAFLRQFGDHLPDAYYDHLNGRPEPDWATLFPLEWAAAVREAWCMELGAEDPRLRLDARLDAIRAEHGDRVILIGGPPCQAYSLVGRARNQGKVGYVAREDGRHFLYEEYIRILDRLRPAAFVMENVKGMLSSSVDGESRIVDKVLEDLGGGQGDGARYDLIALTPRGRRQLDLVGVGPAAAEFVVRAEDHGIPQARHRVIVVGIRSDIAASANPGALAPRLHAGLAPATAGHVLGGMPSLRSGLSRELDDDAAWVAAVTAAMEFVAEIDTTLPDEGQLAFERAAARHLAAFRGRNDVPGRTAVGVGIACDCPEGLRGWLLDPRLETLPNHASRSHMRGDLARYFFAAVFAEVTGRSPKARDFPEELAPDHASWSTGGFADRFRVQVRNAPSTTITSHISKDGHYFIHPDPQQCRALTVREAARLQTFPDNYLFLGNRTQQYVQVGNAVPPLLARWIGEALADILRRVGAPAAPEAASHALRRVA